MILTRRGFAVAGIVALSLGLATLHGPRSLNAIVAPGVVALVAGVVLVRRADQPEVERVPPEDGFTGERRTVQLSLSADSSYAARVRDEVPEALDPSGNEVTTTVGDARVEYEVRYARRGSHELGPLRVTARDVLGLAKRTFEYHKTDEVLVYPHVRELSGEARQELNTLPEFRMVNVRGEFDSLREYERGDALRDIDWKSSAKQPDQDFIVKEYVDEDDLGAVSVVAEADGGRAAADAMAEAAASVAGFLLGAGLTVELSAPAGLAEAGEGPVQRQQVLELLARTGPGAVPQAELNEADVVVRGYSDGRATVSTGGREVPFVRMADDGPALDPEPADDGPERIPEGAAGG